MQHGNYNIEENQRINWPVVRHIWPFLVESRGRVLLALLCLLLAKAAILTIPFVLKNLVDSLEIKSLAETAPILLLGLVLAYEHKRRLLDVQSANSDFGYDFISHDGVALGNVSTYLNVGGEFRVGWLIPNDFGTSALRPGGDNSAPDANWDPRYNVDGNWGLHFFASLDARAVARDIFLDGNSFHDSHSVRKEPLVADLALGASTVFRGVKFSYAQVLRTREFKQQDDSHSYGSLSISYSY